MDFTMDVLTSGPETKKSRGYLPLGQKFAPSDPEENLPQGDPVKEYHVGNGWRYECWNPGCKRQVKIDKPFPKTCPGCGAGGWWGHLVTTGGNGKPRQKIEDGFSIKNSEVMMPEDVRTRTGILTQPENAVEHGKQQNNGVIEDSQGQKRGRPRLTVPSDLILELSGRGLSCRAMANELNKRGYKTGYKTVHRRLQASLL